MPLKRQTLFGIFFDYSLGKSTSIINYFYGHEFVLLIAVSLIFITQNFLSMSIEIFIESTHYNLIHINIDSLA